LPRPRLEQRLAQWAPITIVRGGPGFGKTTLIAEWLDRELSPHVDSIWISAADAPVPDRAFLRELSQRLERRPDVRIALVIDNLGHRVAEELIRDVVPMVQRHRNLHLIAGLRVRHSLETLAAGAAEVNTIGPADLLLTPVEVAELASVLQAQLDDGVLSEFHAAVGGWIAPLRLMIEAAASGRTPDSVAADYIRETLLLGQRDAAVVAELTRLALLEQVDLDLARQLSRQEGRNADAALTELQLSGLIGPRESADPKDFGFPTLVRDVLRADFIARDPAGVRAYHRRVAAWFRDRGAAGASAAFRHAIAGRDLELARDVASEFGLSVGLLDPQAFLDPLAEVTDDELADFPVLRTAKAVLDAQTLDSDADGYSATIRTYFDHCSSIVAQGLDELELEDLLQLGTGHLIGLRSRGEFAESTRFADDVLLRLQTGHELRPGLRACQAWFHLQRGLTSTLSGRYDHAVGCYQLAWELGIRSDADFVPMNAAANLALIHVLRADGSKARLWSARYQEFLGRAPQWTDYLAGLGAHIAAGMQALDRLDAPRAAAEVEYLGDGSNSVELWPFIVHLRAQWALHHGDPANALAVLESAVAAHSEDLATQGAAEELLLRSRADLLTADGQGPRARQLLPADAAGRPLLAVALARLHLLAGEYAVARKVVNRALRRPSLAPRESLDLLLILASASLRLGDEGGGLRAVGRIRELIDTSGIERALLGLPKSDSEVLRRLIAGDWAGPEFGADPLFTSNVPAITLTRREQSLVQILARHGSRQQMAEELYLSVNTIKTQISGLYRKLGVSNRAEAIAALRDLGLLT
jgi:LuxR family maltose regulon positive regulatory protein